MILVTLFDYISKKNQRSLGVQSKRKILAIKRKKSTRRKKNRKTYYWLYIYKTPETGTGYKKEDI